ncbi:DUF1572 family protein [Flavobacteriaceae bacterium TP-CH-4]|uniref:DUF1572 family protein n=1 Tax=Pelagihabitans pacificus TaxID=2696054 RepID=A0A967AUB1_9FLAO|nr:DinB family protein [Pelagihabitans pacificus]NHF60144.1 DUF1572 family protein [Pelagihabitans pacificus]
MNTEERLVSELVQNASFRMDESTRMIKRSLEDISEEELWQRPNESLNSIANLLLHLCGNITQYVIASLGETEDTRKRESEFSTRTGYSKVELFEKLTSTVEKAKKTMEEASIGQLLKRREVQGFYFSGVGIIMHVVEHYSYHTGQIAFWVKQLKNTDLGFYDGMDLNTKNK